MGFAEYKKFDPVELSKEVLAKWKQENCFENVVKARQGAPKFVFFEGPPSANGKPGIHHVMARSIKDAYCRYKTQRGFLVNRKAGWDTHGLPVELGVEKMLGITKEDIGKKISVDDYNMACRKEVMKYTAEWVALTEQIGYWVDMDNPYITYDNRYIETLWYLLKDLYNKGLLYKGYTIQPYSPAAGTGLSSHELNQPGCYRDVKDTTATVQFQVRKDEKSAFLFKGASLDGNVGDQYSLEEGELFFIAWTTTPWTLPSNVALCVGPNIDYVRVASFNPYSGKPAVYMVAKDLLGSNFNPKAADIPLGDYKPGDKLVPYKVLDCFKGKQLEGIRYCQLLPWILPEENTMRVICGDFVSTEEGTGIVHIAPTFGADDDRVGKQNNIAPFTLKDKEGVWRPMVDRTGKFYKVEDLDADFVSTRVKEGYLKFAGRYVKNAYDSSLAPDAETLDVDICVQMKQEGKAFRIEKHVHSYPHCWRTDKPVLYYPLDSWFIKATAVRDEMIELNKQINWKPESTGTGRFGKWLENLQDWNLSRSRYWGTPLPIWRTEDKKEEKCIGSVSELYAEVEKSVEAGVMKSNPFKEKGFVPGDFSDENYNRIDVHKPYIDEIVLVSPGGKPMYRESDLIDVWFDSGAMPYAQEWLKALGTPEFGQTADFIAEGVDQTRGWFYTLHAIHTMVSHTPAFRTVVSNGLVLDKKGEKMSKRLGNAVDPFEQLEKYGPDALGWYMLTNAQPWDNLKFDEAGVDEVRRKFFGTLYNTYSFFALYGNVDKFDAKAQEVPVANRPEIDRWIISYLNSLIRDVKTCYDNYDVTTAGRMIQEFVCDHLSNWYVRLNRKRFWGGTMNEDKLAAYQTLYSCLETVAILAAPIAPFYMDRLFLDLNAVSGRHKEQSVHMTLMPEEDESLIDKDLEERMALAQKSTSMVLALRRKVNIKVRQPLSKIMIPVIDSRLQEQLQKVQGIILSEVNVKQIEFITDTEGLITKKIKPIFKTLGKKYGRQMKEISSAFANFTQKDISAIERSEEYTLSLPSGDVVLQKGDYEISSEDMPGWLVATEGALTLALDIQITDDLRREGTARELVNRIQNLRKDSGFEVTDRISVTVEAKEDVVRSLEGENNFSDYVCAQTLANSLVIAQPSEMEGAEEVEWEDGKTLKIKVER
ncbi:MAG: isoleucine--tRNA ligase [Bacteroidales bacterium]|nr:isoleucine--tRNA ligase [Bacteroidales bacterium]